MQGLESVIFCRTCNTTDLEGNDKHCPFCDSKLITIQRRKVDRLAVKVTEDTRSTIVIPNVDSPWGSLRLVVDRTSNFCPFAYFIEGESEITLGYKYGSVEEYNKPTTRRREKYTKVGYEVKVTTVKETLSQSKVEMTEESSFEHKGKTRSDPGERTWCHIRVDGNAPATEIRAMINDDFSQASQMHAWKMLGKVNFLGWTLFCSHLQEVIRAAREAA